MIASKHEETGSAGPGRDALIVIDIGNGVVHLGIWESMQVTCVRGVPTDEHPQLVEELGQLRQRFGKTAPAAVVISSVVPAVAEQVKEAVADLEGNARALVVGADLPLPAPVAVREPGRVGVDRVCAAAAAFEKTRHACTVVDFGTAITVDLIDDEGTFVGGAIFPGTALQAWALSEGTAALPLVKIQSPEQAVGRDTTEAIRSGILNGVAGAVRGIVEQYATELNAWPQVVATGGDLERLLDRCDFIDSAVTDLTLMGVGLAFARHRPGAGK